MARRVASSTRVKSTVDERADEASAPLPRRWIRWTVSLVVTLHLVAIFMAPLSARPNPSPLSQSLVRFFQPYLDTAYLNHGYGFFSPDPGSSVLIRYEVELADGTSVRGTLPDRRKHWPRLLYHRHFMLASQSDGFPGLPESFARHLLHKHGGRRVKLELVEHLPALPAQVLEGRQLTAPESYIVRNEATLDAAGNYAERSIAPPPLPPGMLAPPGDEVPPFGAEDGPALGPVYRGPLAPPRRAGEILP